MKLPSLPSPPPPSTVRRAVAPWALAMMIPLLIACQRPAAPAGTADASAKAPADRGFIATQVDHAMEKARTELRNGNLSLNGDGELHINGVHMRRSGGGKLPQAEITPQGQLLVEGKQVATSAAQQAQLRDYREQVIGIAEAGMAMGSHGLDIAGTVVSGALGAVFSGEKGQKELEARIKAEGEKMQAKARQLCTRLPALKKTQDELAASLPAFAPYATMTSGDVDDCDGKMRGKARDSNDAGQDEDAADETAA